jgi:hypothetical protein
MAALSIFADAVAVQKLLFLSSQDGMMVGH